MNEDLAIRLRQACHDKLTAGTVPLTAIRFLHWAPGNDNLWAGLEQCLAEYMGASINGRAREPLLFFGLHSDSTHFPASYRELFTLGAGYLPYEASEHEVAKQWEKACVDAQGTFDEDLIKPYCKGLSDLLGNIRHLFERRLEHIETQRDIVAPGSNYSSGFLEPTPQYTKGQQAMIDRLQQYRSFIERLEDDPEHEGRLFAAIENFGVAWVGLKNALERFGKGNLPSMDPVLMTLEEVAEGLKNSISCIKEIEQKIGRGSYE